MLVFLRDSRVRYPCCAVLRVVERCSGKSGKEFGSVALECIRVAVHQEKYLLPITKSCRTNVVVAATK